MTLLKPFIKDFGLVVNISPTSISSILLLTDALNKRLILTLIFLMLLLIQGCSSVGDSEKSDENIDTLSKDIVDMVDVSVNEQGVINDNVNDSLDVNLSRSTKNLYLEQAEQRLVNVPVDVLTQYKQALALMKNQQWQAAEQLFEQVLVSQPQLSGAYVNKALIAIERKDLGRASEELDKALEVNSINPYAHQLSGQVSRLTGHFEQAEKSYLEALRIWPEYLEAQINLAILLELYRGRLLDARTYYMTYLNLKPDDVQVQRWLAGVEIKIKRAGLVFPEKTENNSSVKPLGNLLGNPLENPLENASGDN